MATGLSTLVIAVPVVLSASAYAQVATDGTVGPRVRLGGPEYAIGADLGTRAGPNLFHSFERFSLATGERATFSGPDQIRRVISRVTGGARSDIDGTIKSTIAGADFFFINPAGVVFGPKASLDVQGSFHVSTADELRFADGTRFSASNPASSFTVAAPEAFGFLGTAPAGIRVAGSTLAVPTGAALSLVGGDVRLAQGVVRAEAGQIRLAAVGGPGETRLDSGAIAADRKADISLTDLALVDTSGDGGGAVRIRGGQILVENRSAVLADNIGALDAEAGIDVQGETVRVRRESLLSARSSNSGAGGAMRIAADLVEVDINSGIAADTSAEGRAGQVEVTADTLAVRAGSFVRSRTLVGGDAGRIALNVGSLLIDGAGARSATGVLNDTLLATGNAGEVVVTAQAIDIRSGGFIRSNTFASGNAGRVAVNAKRLVIDSGGSFVPAAILSDATGDPLFGTVATGDAGTVEVVARDLLVRDGGRISSATFGPGVAGDVIVRAERAVVDGGDLSVVTTITSRSAASLGGGVVASGDAGAVTVIAGDLQVLGGGTIDSATLGRGDAGAVDVQADALLISGAGSKITSQAASALGGMIVAEGKAGTVSVTADDLRVLDGATIDSVTFGSGDAGAVIVRADRLLIDGGGSNLVTAISSRAANTPDFSVVATGSAGRVTVRAHEVDVLGGATIDSVAVGPGDAGSVTVQADGLLLDGPDTVIASLAAAGSEGDAGSVRVQADEIRISKAAEISSANLGLGVAGEVTVEASDRLLLDDAEITTDSRSAGGGAIQVLVGDVIDLRDSAITSSVAGGADPTAGNILIDPKVLVIDGSEIHADAPVGFGGNVKIDADNILVPGGDFQALIDNGEISATGGTPERAGTVAVNTPEVDLSGGLVVLEGTIIDTAPLRARCASRRDIGASSFTGIGRAGLPPSPDGPLASAYVIDEAAVGEAQTALAPTDVTSAASNVRLASLVAPCAPLD